MSATDGHPRGGQRERARRPAVVCTSCDFAWHSPVMAYGLRLLGSCPRCDGRLDFDHARPSGPVEPGGTAAGAPHLALGLPRPPRRD